MDVKKLKQASVIFGIIKGVITLILITCTTHNGIKEIKEIAYGK